MEFKFATSILFSNMGYVLKILLWILICILIVAAIGAAIIIPVFGAVAEQTDIEAAYTGIGSAVNGLFDGNLSIRQFAENVMGQVAYAAQQMALMPGAIVGLVFAVIFLYMLYCFLSGILYYPIAHIINDVMSSNMRTGLASSIALHFKTAVRYSFARLLISFPVDLIIALAMFGLAYGLIGAIKIFAMPVLIVFGILCVTMRSLLFSGWLPRTLYHPEEKIFMAFSRSLTSVKINFKGLFKAFSITFILSYLMIAGFSIPTFGLINLFVPSVYYFLLRTAELVGYYKVKGFSFYTDASTVINTVEFGYRSANQARDDDETAERDEEV